MVSQAPDFYERTIVYQDAQHYRNTQEPDPYLRVPAGREPRQRLVDAIVPEITTELFRFYPDGLASKGMVEHAKQRRLQPAMNETGSGSFVVQNSRSSMDLFELPVDGWDLALHRRRGVPVFMQIVENAKRISKAQGGEGAEITTFGNRGWLALLDRIVIDPPRGPRERNQPEAEHRLFSWPSPSFIPTGWRPAKVLCTVETLVAAWLFVSGGTIDVHGSFHDQTALLLSPWSGTLVSAPVGTNYYIQDVFLARSGPYEFETLSDDNMDGFWIDEEPQPALVNPGWTRSSSSIVELTAGTHRLAWSVENWPIDPFYVINPCYSAWSCYLGGYGLFGNTTPTAHSNGSAKLLEYPASPPGMTAGEAVTIAINEARARGSEIALALRPTFSRTNDSAGRPWSITGDIATLISGSLLTFLRELSGTYFDMQMRPSPEGLYLDLYLKDTHGGVLDDELGSYTRLEHVQQA